MIYPDLQTPQGAAPVAAPPVSIEYVEDPFIEPGDKCEIYYVYAQSGDDRVAIGEVALGTMFPKQWTFHAYQKVTGRKLGPSHQTLGYIKYWISEFAQDLDVAAIAARQRAERAVVIAEQAALLSQMPEDQEEVA